MPSNLTAKKAAALLALLAVVSALLSNYVQLDPWELLKVAVFARDKFPVLPAIYFGVVLCVGVFLWETRSAAMLVVAFAAAVIAWIAAYESGYWTYLVLHHSLSNPAALFQHVPFLYAVAGIVAGLVGSFVAAAGIAIVSPDFRTGGNLVRTILIGAGAGALLHFHDTEFHTILPLFLVWQPAVAASIAHGMVKPKSLRSAGAIRIEPA